MKIEDPENWCPLCNDCHNWAHQVSTRTSTPILKAEMAERLKEAYFGPATDFSRGDF